ncbi:MAG: exodeoxyribonuclease VII large subunit [Acidobacteriota bacterium]|nr:exodeoxyribonuclease VII large subunit [Acidobacteriota bacterium]
MDDRAELPVGTYRVSELAEDLKAVLAEVYPQVWVVGEIQRLRTSSAGHLYFELVEKGAGDAIVGKLDCAVFRRDLTRARRALARTGQELGVGREIRCRGELDFYPAGGRLQFIVREIDAVFSLGLVERRRREILDRLRQAGLHDRNRGLAMAELPLRVGLVTSHGSAAYHDFVSSLEESGYAFELSFQHAPVQGSDAVHRVVRALEAMRVLPVDCLVVTRGGGARSDLAVFDSLEVAEAIARSPFPVLTGLGHETDESIADLVAHAAFKTPTKVAEHLVQRVAAVESRLERVATALARLGRLPVQRSRHRLEAVEARLPAAAGRVRQARRRLDELRARVATAARVGLGGASRRRAALAERLVLAAPRRVAVSRPRLAAVCRRIADLSSATVREESVRIAALARLAEELSPRRVLARGFSVTRTVEGRLVRSATELTVGDVVGTDVAGGSFESRVENFRDPQVEETK